MNQAKKRDILSESLLSYIENRSAEYAVLLTGEWGSGKSYYVKNTLRESWGPTKINGQLTEYQRRTKDGRKIIPIYVSLFGLSSEAEFRETINLQLLLRGANSKAIEEAIKKLKGLVGGGADAADRLFDIPASLLQGVLSVGFSFIPVEQKENEQIILFFDDLERTKIAIEPMLGIINDLVEHRKLKVILLADVAKMEKRAAFRKYKEKVVGQTFFFQSDFDSFFPNILTSYSKSWAENYLAFLGNKELKSDIVRVCFNGKTTNIRSLKKTMAVFERYFAIWIDWLNKDESGKKDTCDVAKEFLHLLLCTILDDQSLLSPEIMKVACLEGFSSVRYPENYAHEKKIKNRIHLLPSRLQNAHMSIGLYQWAILGEWNEPQIQLDIDHYRILEIGSNRHERLLLDHQYLQLGTEEAITVTLAKTISLMNKHSLSMHQISQFVNVVIELNDLYDMHIVTDRAKNAIESYLAEAEKISASDLKRRALMKRFSLEERDRSSSDHPLWARLTRCYQVLLNRLQDKEIEDALRDGFIDEMIRLEKGESIIDMAYCSKIAHRLSELTLEELKSIERLLSLVNSSGRISKFTPPAFFDPLSPELASFMIKKLSVLKTETKDRIKMRILNDLIAGFNKKTTRHLDS